MAAVVLHHVSKNFAGGVVAVADLSLTIADGEFIVLVGPSGCGKTTTLRLLAGLETPSAGRIEMGGRDVTRLPPYRRDVALVAQRPALYPHLSVRENLEFGRRMREEPTLLVRLFARWLRPDLRKMREERAARVKEIAALLHLEELLDRKPGQLSGGQQQRVALGRALVRRPAVFLLDEPFSNLDVSLGQEMRKQLHLLRGHLPTTIYVTHDPAEAISLADRVVVLRAGLVQQIDRPTVLYDQPGNRFVAEFVGSPPMNFLAGDVASRPERTLGIRPEAVRLARESGTDVALQADLLLVENRGDCRLATFRSRFGEVTVLLPNGPQLASGSVEVYLDMTKAYWFDRQSGEAVRTT